MQGWKCCWLRYRHTGIVHCFRSLAGPLPPCKPPLLRVCRGAFPNSCRSCTICMTKQAAVSPFGAVLQSYAKNMGLYGECFPCCFTLLLDSS